MFKKLKKAGEMSYWLESCNVCSACCAVEAVGGEWINPIPKDIDGKKIMGQDDLLFDYLQIADVKAKHDSILPNEFAENLACTLPKVAHVKTSFNQNASSNKTSKLIHALQQGHAVVQSYKTDYGGGHFICIVAYDETKDIFYCYDSWSANKHCKNEGRLEEYPSSFFNTRARSYYVEVWV